MQNFPVVRIALDFSRSFLSVCGLFRFVSVAAGELHFPMQKREKMAERTVAEVTGSASAVVSSEDR